MKSWPAAVLLTGCIASGCGSRAPEAELAVADRPATFGEDLAFLREHTPIVVLGSGDGQSQVAVAPAYQGRVMTSTAAGAEGTSFGYIHRPVIAQGARQPHMTVLGGEDRFWLGPEGGQYALYFAKGAPFDTASWQVPEPIDWGAWPIVAQSDHEVVFAQPMTLTNYAGTEFRLHVDRTLRLLDRAAIFRELGVGPAPGTTVVGYESDNRITNTGARPWRKEEGLVSIWILGMFPPARRTTVVIPYQGGDVSERGPIVNDRYFGAPPPDRLRIGPEAIFFRGDGRERGKIGVPKPRARNAAGSYDPDRGVLTLVQFTVPQGADAYVNSMWEMQADPYGGDVINSYNDGPLGPGQPPLGPFYEIESSSPAAALAPGASMRHVHRTIHLKGPASALDVVATTVLGVTLDNIQAALP